MTETLVACALFLTAAILKALWAHARFDSARADLIRSRNQREQEGHDTYMAAHRPMEPDK